MSRFVLTGPQTGPIRLHGSFKLGDLRIENYGHSNKHRNYLDEPGVCRRDLTSIGAPGHHHNVSLIPGSNDVASGATEIRVTFNKPVQRRSWSWSTLAD